MVSTRKRTRIERGLKDPPPEILESALEVVVIHTGTDGTFRASRTAAALATGLAARIRLLVLEVVPYALSLNAPNIPVEFTRRHFRTIALCARIDAHIDIRIGRDTARMLDAALKTRSVIVMGIRPGWWPTSQRRLAKRLTRQGHWVLFATFPSARSGSKGHDHVFRVEPVRSGSVEVMRW